MRVGLSHALACSGDEVTFLGSPIALRLKRKVEDIVRDLDDKHAQISDQADTAAKASRVVAAVAVAGAAVAAPTGLSAVGVAIGVFSTPVIVSAAPVLVAVAGGAAAISAAASLYSKARRKKLATSAQDAPPPRA